MKKKKGFTLSEVLVTITIIGIIAAIAIPTLMNKYRTAEVESRLKKAYSTLSQAANNARAVGYDWGIWADSMTSNPNWGTLDDERYFYENYLRPYVNTLRYKEFGTSSILAELLDGTQIVIGKGGCADFHVDINGDKGPNEYGIDNFIFNYCPTSASASFETDKLIPYATKDIVTREQALDLCKNPSTEGKQCSKLIMMDGWKIKDDYPFSI